MQQTDHHGGNQYIFMMRYADHYIDIHLILMNQGPDHRNNYCCDTLQVNILTSILFNDQKQMNGQSLSFNFVALLLSCLNNPDDRQNP
jgi:hypothetical protein